MKEYYATVFQLAASRSQHRPIDPSGPRPSQMHNILLGSSALHHLPVIPAAKIAICSQGSRGQML